jgi:hypothetical protein
MFKSPKFSSITTAEVYGWVFNELLPQARLHASKWPRCYSDPFGFGGMRLRTGGYARRVGLTGKDDSVCFDVSVNYCVSIFLRQLSESKSGMSTSRLLLNRKQYADPIVLCRAEDGLGFHTTPSSDSSYIQEHQSSDWQSACEVAAGQIHRTSCRS